MNLAGKRVFITGASKGIGEAAAIAFADAGAKVGVAARNAGALDGLVGRITGKGGAAKAYALDVTDARAVRAAIDDFAAAYGGLDVMINNAGLIDPVARADALDPADFARVIDVNVNGVFNGIHAALAHMKDGGTIITVGSGAATSALEGWSHYCASKAAVHHLNACIDKEFRDSGIRALVLSPGTVATDMQRIISTSGVNPVSQLKWSDHIPPDWPARALMWMCTPAADGFRGQVVALREDAVRRAVGLIA